MKPPRRSGGGASLRHPVTFRSPDPAPRASRRGLSFEEGDTDQDGIAVLRAGNNNCFLDVVAPLPSHANIIMYIPLLLWRAGTHAPRAVIILLALLEAALAPRAAAAQCTTPDSECSDHAPFVSILPDGGSYTESGLWIDISWADDRELNFNTRSITVNGTAAEALTHSGTSTGARTVGIITLASGTNLLVARICDFPPPGKDPQCTEATATYTYTPPPPPEARSTPGAVHASHPRIRFASAFDAVASYTMPAYTSMDGARAFGLVYRAAEARTWIYAEIDATDNSTEAPSYMSLELRGNDGSLVVPETFFAAAHRGTVRMGVQWVAPYLGTSMQRYHAVVRSYWSDGSFKESAIVPVRVNLIGSGDSPYGAGWSVAGIQRLILTSYAAMSVNGDGSATRWDIVNGQYVAPDGEFSTLAVEGTGYVRRYPDGTEARFDGAGYMSTLRDRFGRQENYTYDAAGRLMTITDPAGKQTVLAYDGAGKLATVTDPAGRVSRFTVVNGQLVEIRDPDGGVAFAATYGSDHRMRTRTLRGSGTYGYAYDAAGLVVADTLPAVPVDGGAAERLVARQRPWESLFLGGPSPAARVTTSRTLARAAFFSPAGDSTRVQLDRYGLPLRVETPHGKFAEYRRNQHGQPTQEWTELGGVMAYSWSGPDLTGYTDPVTGLWMTVDYRPDHQPRVVEYGEYVVSYEYDAAGHLLKTRTGGDSTVYTYTADHRVQSVRDAAGRLTTFTYQQPGEGTGFRNLRRVEDTDPATGGWRQTDYEIDNAGRAVAVTLNGLTSRVRPDALNRDTASTDPLGRTVRTSYPNDTTVVVTDAAGKPYSFTADALGRTLRETDPEGRIRSFGYDRAGNRSRVVNRRGQTITFTHDSIGRVRSRTADGETTTYDYGIRDERHWSSATVPGLGTDTVFADARGRTLSEATQHGGVPRRDRTHTLSAEGMRTALSFGTSLGTRSHTWRWQNGTGRLEHMRGSGSAADSSRLIYAGALLDRVNFHTGPHQALEYSGNAARSLVRTKWGFGGGADVAVGRHYTPDSFGRLHYIADGDQDQHRRGFDYDVAGRLAGYSHWGKVDGPLVCQDPMLPDTCTKERLWQMQDTTTYAYDAADNRSGAGITLEPNSNRYDYFGGYAHDYDADGNLIYRSNGSTTQSFSWNSLGQLTGVTTNGVAVTYAYDGWGRRVQRTQGGSITRYVYDGDDLLQETDGSGGLLREYLYYPGVDEPHSVRVWAGGLGGKLYRYAMESPGHVIGLMDSTGTVVNHYRYDPWGAVEGASEGVSQPLRYMAREYDAAAGLYYVRNRWYMPGQGRFISEDPIGFEGGMNWYAYAANSPTNLRDPYGLEPCDPNEWCSGTVHLAPAITGCLIGWTLGDDYRCRSGRGGGRDWLGTASNFFAGFGDFITFGATDWVRDQIDANDGVDFCSDTYTAGEWAATGVSLLTGVAGGVKAAGSRGAGREFSHWIPKRWGGPHTILNGNYVTRVQHALSDPYRYRFMPRAWKEANPMPNVAVQQWNRLPNVYKGAGAGAAFAGAAAAASGSSGCGG